MVSVPGFLLRRLYVKQSLRNTDKGVEFELMNRLGSGYAHTMLPLTIDGIALPLEGSYFVFDGVETAFSMVSKDRTFTLAMNKTITIQADGVKLEPGPHKIGMGFEVPGLGALKFDVTDVVSEG